MTSALEKVFGKYVDLGPCLVGMNLNQTTVRGFGDLATLAMISGPDVYDSVANKEGTQRDLKKAHAKQVYAYARESVGVNPDVHPRSFPEVLFNIRDTSCVEFYDINSPSKVIEQGELLKTLEGHSSLVGLRVKTDSLTFPALPHAPQISRVDGNHRLSGVNVDELLEEGQSSIGVSIPFCIFVDLSKLQEIRLFADINGNVARMNVDHLKNITIRTTKDDELRDSEPALWLAKQITQPGRAFADTVFLGGSKVGLKQLGAVPPINLNALVKVMSLMLARTAAIEATHTYEDVLELFNNYWSAVRKVFADEWEDKKNYILLQAIGLTGFAGLGAELCQRGVHTAKVSKEDFAEVLMAIKDQVSLAKSDPLWAYAAGPTGGKKVETELFKAATDENVNAFKSRQTLRGTSPRKWTLENRPF
jgi:DGQHR domain-containing protein